MKVVKVVTKKYVVTDNFGHNSVFLDKTVALRYESIVRGERKVIKLIRPKGVTLVVSKNENVFFKVVPAILGFNGLPYAEANKDKNREHFMNTLDPINPYSSITGGIVSVLKQTYHRITNATGTYNLWNKRYGNSSMDLALHPTYWSKGALWYNWDGENFSTNDKQCKITNADFKEE
jgi:hypothetical protein